MYLVGSRLPSHIEVKQFLQSYDFILKWDPEFNNNVYPYEVAIDSHFVHENMTTNNGAVYVTLNNSAIYNVTL